MADYLGTVLPGITVTAIGGLAFVAYRHPARYRDLAGILAILCNLVLVGGIVWNMGIAAAYSAVVKVELLGDKYREVAGIIGGLEISLWWLLVSAAVQCYILVLTQLRNWLPDEQSPVAVRVENTRSSDSNSSTVTGQAPGTSNGG